MKIHRNIAEHLKQSLRSAHEAAHSLADDIITAHEHCGKIDPVYVEDYNKCTFELANAIRNYGNAFQTLLAQYNALQK